MTNSLEHLTLECDRERESLLEDAISSFVCRRGSSLKTFDSDIPLSKATIHHLMRLPNLRSWVATHEPPRTLPPVAFPSLEVLRLESAALPWLHLLTPPTSRTNLRETLKFLGCPRGTVIDSTFSSSVANFRNLVGLRVEEYCSGAEGCISRLTDDDVENLADALPRLNHLQLTKPCHLNSCKTTVSSLLSLSTHCLGLKLLEIHFNTRTIVGDMRHLLDGGFGRDKAKCGLRHLRVGRLPLEAGGEDVETITTGFKVIFPCLDTCTGGGRWYLVHTALSALD